MCDHPGCICHIFSMDTKTPINLHLSAYYKRSFAFKTVKERLPVILTKIIDHLVRDKEKIIKMFGEESKEELKKVIGEISRLKYEMQTNKALEKFNSEIPDTKIYDQVISELACDGEPKYFTTIWLLVECYMYRRVRFIFENTIALTKYDPFRWQKKDSFYGSFNAIVLLIEYFIRIIRPGKGDNKQNFLGLLKLNLWGNRCDLSLSGGEANSQEMGPGELVKSFEPYVLCNHSEFIWECLSEEDDSHQSVEFVNDNAGFEMITDLCVADFIITHELAKKIVFNVKQIPWFVSDTTIPDFRWIIRHLINSDLEYLKKIGIRWNKYLREKIWMIEDDPFWTSPLDFTNMKEHAPQIYKRMSDAKLVIFKGDLNYRKLFGEKNWEPTTPVRTALQGFEPTRICTLRTLKSDIICGLKKGVAEELDKKDPGWLITGNYGVIQYSEINTDEGAKSVNSLP